MQSSCSSLKIYLVSNDELTALKSKYLYIFFETYFTYNLNPFKDLSFKG